mmetsp:Transcript_3115/g.4739  ORF Transcript_3115/g.4739 Transcript_3115/m.4739 type:complete len:95 (-) Transcript_3115:162-446(-)
MNQVLICQIIFFFRSNCSNCNYYPTNITKKLLMPTMTTMDVLRLHLRASSQPPASATKKNYKSSMQDDFPAFIPKEESNAPLRTFILDDFTERL